MTDIAVSAADLIKIGAAAVLGFLANFVLQYVQARRQPRRRIVYDASIVPALEQVEPNIARDMDIHFEGQRVEHLQYHRICFTNAGNSQINDQSFRIKAPKESKVLRYYFDPPPEYELGVEDSRVRENDNSWMFNVSAFRPQESIIAHMIIDGEGSEILDIFSKNKTEYVELIPGRVESFRDDRSKLQTFFLLVSLWFLLPPLAELLIFSPFRSIAAGAIYLLLLVAIAPRLGFACHQIAGLFLALQNKDAGDQYSITIGNKARSVIVSTASNNAITMTTPIEEAVPTNALPMEK